jgi:hypothetical protein
VLDKFLILENKNTDIFLGMNTREAAPFSLIFQRKKEPFKMSRIKLATRATASLYADIEDRYIFEPNQFFT